MTKTILFCLLSIAACVVFVTCGEPTSGQQFKEIGISGDDNCQPTETISIQGGEANNKDDVNEGLKRQEPTGDSGVSSNDKLPPLAQNLHRFSARQSALRTANSRPTVENKPQTSNGNTLYGSRSSSEQNPRTNPTGNLNRPNYSSGDLKSSHLNRLMSQFVPYGNNINQPSPPSPPNSGKGLSDVYGRKNSFGNNVIPSSKPNSGKGSLPNSYGRKNTFGNNVIPSSKPNSGKGSLPYSYGRKNTFASSTERLSVPDSGKDLTDLLGPQKSYGRSTGQSNDVNTFSKPNSDVDNNSLRPKYKPTAAVDDNSDSYREKLSGLGHDYSPDTTITKDASTPGVDLYTIGTTRKVEPDFPVPEFPARTRYNIGEDEANIILKNVYDRTDYYRSRHGRGLLTLNQNLVNLAQDWVNHLASKDEWGHRPNNNLGENISRSLNLPNPGRFAVDGWYEEMIIFVPDDSERQLYDNDPSQHMTQLLWIKSREVGCAAAKSLINKIYVVCNYNPPGNVEDFYKKNLVGISNDDVVRATKEKAERMEELKRYFEARKQNALQGRKQQQNINNSIFG